MNREPCLFRIRRKISPPSEATIRADLRFLSKKAWLRCFHGGAAQIMSGIVKPETQSGLKSDFSSPARRKTE
ncbi:DeoR family transcriptional regulator [Shigella flexneri]